ncbi:conserved protein of unknown function [Methylorubrum extorquens]|uniref:Uncharacterized protein n=1 Tax=Methylorubrum extorquens TaxID=408 RepID=A0A2N9AJ05_METEX|nr:conserved protein of unknown function [Methylorubrum extorquens]
MVYAVRFGAGTSRRFLAHSDTAGDNANGWRPLIWTKSVERAEKFGCAADAHAYALKHLGHSLWEVGVVPSRGLPTDDLGGSPNTLRVAA